MTATDLTTKTPTEIDIILSKALMSKSLIEEKLDTAMKNHELLGASLDRTFLARKEETDKARLIHLESTIDSLQNSIDAQEDELDNIEARLAEAWLIVDDCEHEFKRRGGWSRFWQVANSNGHVHASQDCSTCSARTAYVWLAEFAGSTDVRVLTEAGSSTCTVCFRDAPADMFARASRLENPKKRYARLLDEVKNAQ